VAISPRLYEQMRFLVEVDKVKSVLRRNHVLHEDRRENDAEHSWHLAMMAIVLSEHAAEPVDVLRTVKMVLIHDLVEIDAGDTFAFDEAASLTQPERETKAAERIFGLLPADQAAEFHGLWREFEEKQTVEARFATALDRLGGVLPSYHSDGGCWRGPGMTHDKVLAKNCVIDAGAPPLWEYAQVLIEEVAAQGWIGVKDASEPVSSAAG